MSTCTNLMLLLGMLTIVSDGVRAQAFADIDNGRSLNPMAIEEDITDSEFEADFEDVADSEFGELAFEELIASEMIDAGDEGEAEGGVAFGNEIVYLVFTANVSIPGVGTVTNEDIVSFSPATGVWALYFDGSDVGLSAHAIDGLARIPGTLDLLLSFKDPGTVAGLTGGPSGTNVDDSDIVKFTPMSLGANTAGSFSFYFDGSDIGLMTDSEDIDAIAFAPDGSLLISTLGGFSGGNTSGADEDLHRYTGSLGTLTSGVLNIYFDGSDVELTAASHENVDGAAVLPDERILLSTAGTFCVGGIIGADPDVLLFTPSVLGDITIGFWTLYLENTEVGISSSAHVAALDVIVDPI